MDTFSVSELRRLSAIRQGQCVTIFMPTHASGRDGQQDALRLKNLVSQAERDLVEQGLRSPDAKRWLEPVRDLPSDPVFWEKRSQGLAMFVSEGIFERYRVPIELAESLVVNRRFQFKPLVSLLSGNSPFFVLALSQNHVRFFAGDKFHLREQRIEDMPTNLEKALSFVSGARGLQVHSTHRGDAGKQGVAFHGQGGERDTAKDDLANFFRLVDAGLRGVLREQTAPLILAGVQYLLPIFREVSTYAHIHSQELPGNAEHLSEQDLHARAWPLISARGVQARDESVARYRQLAGTGRTADGVHGVLPAAQQGQVETLFVDRGAHQWGSFDAATGEVRVSPEPQPGDDDLVDLATVETLLHRGTVFCVPAEQCPSPTICGIFRY